MNWTKTPNGNYESGLYQLVKRLDRRFDVIRNGEKVNLKRLTLAEAKAMCEAAAVDDAAEGTPTDPVVVLPAEVIPAEPQGTLYAPPDEPLGKPLIKVLTEEGTDDAARQDADRQVEQLEAARLERLAADDAANRTPDADLDPSEREDQPEEVEKNRALEERLAGLGDEKSLDPTLEKFTTAPSSSSALEEGPEAIPMPAVPQKTKAPKKKAGNSKAPAPDVPPAGKPVDILTGLFRKLGKNWTQWPDAEERLAEAGLNPEDAPPELVAQASMKAFDKEEFAFQVEEAAKSSNELSWPLEPACEKWDSAVVWSWVSLCGRYRVLRIEPAGGNDKRYGVDLRTDGGWGRSLEHDGEDGRKGYPRFWRTLERALWAAGEHLGKMLGQETKGNAAAVVAAAEARGLGDFRQRLEESSGSTGGGLKLEEANGTETIINQNESEETMAATKVAKETVGLPEAEARRMMVSLGFKLAGDTKRWPVKKLADKVNALGTADGLQEPLEAGDKAAFKRVAQALADGKRVAVEGADAAPKGKGKGKATKAGKRPSDNGAAAKNGDVEGIPHAPIVTGTNAGWNKKYEAIYSAATRGDLAELKAIQTNPNAVQTYAKKAHKYKLACLAAMKK